MMCGALVQNVASLSAVEMDMAPTMTAVDLQLANVKVPQCDIGYIVIFRYLLH